MRFIACKLRSVVPALAALLSTASPALAVPVLDGTGFGSPSATVTYDANAPISNFGSPGSTTSGAAYDVYTRADATYAYVLLKTNGGGGTSPTPPFANLYFGTGSSATATSDIGFEVTNERLFTPGVAGYTSTAGRDDIGFATLNSGSIEFAVAFSYFETDPQKVGFTPTTAANPNIILRLSQSFGYSVAGGASYGANRLGLISDPIGSTPVPEPATLALLGFGLAGVGLIRRKRA